MYTGLPICARLYRTHMGPIRPSPYNRPMWGPDSKPIWAPCVMVRHMAIWVQCVQAHIDTPIMDPCVAQIAIPYGPSVGCIRVAHMETPIKDPYGSHTSSTYGHAHTGPMWAQIISLFRPHVRWSHTAKPLWAHPYSTHMGPMPTRA